MSRVLLRYIPANNVMHHETKTFFGARADQKHKKSKKYDEKCSIFCELKSGTAECLPCVLLCA